MTRRVAIWARRLAVMTQKELLHLGRDLPLLLFLIYSFTLSNYISSKGVTMQLRNAAVFVHDEDHSESSRDLIHRFQPPYFSLRGEITDPVIGLRLLDRGTAMALLNIPPRFHEMLQGGEQPALQLLVDTSNAAQGFSAAAYAMRIVGQFGAETRIRANKHDPYPAINSEHRVWFNPDQNEAWFQSMTHLLRMITLFAILLPAAALVREKERGTIEQLLVSPLSPFQIMFSKVLAMTVVVLGATAVTVFGIMQPVFHVPMRGSGLLFFIVTAIFVMTSAGFGLLAATLTRNQAQVGMVTLLAVAPMLLLSGINSPYETMPAWVRGLMSLSPLRYYADLTVGLLLKGNGIDLLWKSVLSMLILGAVVFSLGMWRFRRQFE